MMKHISELQKTNELKSINALASQIQLWILLRPAERKFSFDTVASEVRTVRVVCIAAVESRAD